MSEKMTKVTYLVPNLWSHYTNPDPREFDSYEKAEEFALNFVREGKEAPITRKEVIVEDYVSQAFLQEEVNKGRLTLDIDDLECILTGADPKFTEVQRIIDFMKAHKVYKLTLDFPSQKILNIKELK